MFHTVGTALSNVISNKESGSLNARSCTEGVMSLEKIAIFKRVQKGSSGRTESQTFSILWNEACGLEYLQPEEMANQRFLVR